MTVIKIKNSNVAGRVPASGDLEVAELGINLQDKKLYSKDASGSIFEIGAAGDIPSGSAPPNAGNNVGDLFWDTTDGALKYYDGATWQTVTIEPADGKGYVEVGGDNMEGNLTLGGDKITLDASNGSAVFAGGDISLNANGSASFVDDISIGDGTKTDSLLLLNGATNAGVVSETFFMGSRSDAIGGIDGTTRFNILNGTNPVVSIGSNNFFNVANLSVDASYGSGTPVINLNADGSATFNGLVTFNGGTSGANSRAIELNGDIGIHLEPDNPANYTTTTEEYEDTITGPGGKVEKTVTKTREVKTYTGPTLDVKEELIALRERATQQDAVIEQMTAALRELGKDVTSMPVTGEEEPKTSRKQKR